MSVTRSVHRTQWPQELQAQVAVFHGLTAALSSFLAQIGEWEEAEGITALSDGARAKLLDLLAALGDHPDQIAVSLATRNCLGDKGDALGCPVYRYLADVLGAGDLEVLAVDAEQIAVSEDGGMTSSFLVPPECVAEFIRRFDRHEYPELVRVRATPVRPLPSAMPGR